MAKISFRPKMIYTSNAEESEGNINQSRTSLWSMTRGLQSTPSFMEHHSIINNPIKPSILKKKMILPKKISVSKISRGIVLNI